MNPNDLSTSPRASATNPSASGVPGLAPESSLHFLRKDEAGAEANGVGAVNALVVVLLVAGLLFWFLRRLGVAGAGASGGKGAGWQRMLRLPEGDGLKVLQSTRLTPKATVHVLEWGQGRWLIVCNEGATTVVASQPGDAPAVEAGNARAAVTGEGQ